MLIQVQAEIRAKKRAQASSLADESLSTDAEAHEEAQFLTVMENKRLKRAEDTLWWTLIIQPGYLLIPFELIWRIQDCEG